MSKISKREQFLLFFLVLILLGVLFYVAVYTPAQTKKLESDAKIAELEAQKLVMDTTLPLYGKLEKDVEVALEKVKVELDNIEDTIDEAKFERWFFPLLKDREVTVMSTVFTPIEVASPSSGVYVKNDPMYSVKQMIDEINEVASVQKTPATTESVLLKSQYTYEIKSEYKDFADILDDIASWNTTFFVNSSSYNFKDKIGTIKVDAYTIDKFEVNDDDRYKGLYSKDGLKNPIALAEPTNPGTGNPTTGVVSGKPDYVDENNNNIDDNDEDLDGNGGITYYPECPTCGGNK